MTVAATQRILHLGCGRRGRQLPEAIGLIERDGCEVLSVDADPALRPDIVCRLGQMAIPCDDDSVDCAVAFHVLEHIGRQGETAEWFAFWEDLYRVLKPGAQLFLESPLYTSVWAWADPSHTRALSPQAFTFLAQENYRIPGSSISPFRIKCDFVPVTPFTGVADVNPTIAAAEGSSHFRGVLAAVKPLRPWWDA